MKRAISLILVLLCVVLCFAGCKKKEERKNHNNDLSEYVVLGNYKGIEINKKSDDYKNMYDNYHEYYVAGADAYNQIKEGKVKKGDTVNIDYEGKYADTGKAFDGGTAEGTDLTIGSKTFIDGFEDGLIDKEIGKTVDLNLTFPKDYSSTDLAGKKVVFTVKINYVKTVPEITDEVAKKIGAKNKKDYTDRLDREVMKQLIYNAVTSDKKLVYKSYPEDEKNKVEESYNEFMSYAQQQATQYNQQYNTNASAEDMVYYLTNGQYTSSAAYKQFLFQQLKDELLFYAIFDAEKMELPENYDAFLKKTTGETDAVKLEEIKSQYTEEDLEALYVQETVFDFLIKNAKIK